MASKQEGLEDSAAEDSRTLLSTVRSASQDDSANAEVSPPLSARGRTLSIMLEEGEDGDEELEDVAEVSEMTPARNGGLQPEPEPVSELERAAGFPKPEQKKKRRAKQKVPPQLHKWPAEIESFPPGCLAQAFLAVADKRYPEEERPPAYASASSPMSARPMPPAPQPFNPKAPQALGRTVREMDGSSKVADVRGASAAPDRRPRAAEPSPRSLGGSADVAVGGGAGAGGELPTRRSYGGVLSHKGFAKASSMSQLSEADRQACLQDMEKDRERRLLEAQEKQTKYKSVQTKLKAEEVSRRQAFENELKQLEEDRRLRKVEEMKKWLARKEDEARAKKAKVAEMEKVLREKDLMREQARREEEDSRNELKHKLRTVADRRRKALEDLTKASASRLEERGKEPLPPPAGELAPPWAQLPRRSESLPQLAGSPAKPRGRVVHVHVHHHMHEEGEVSGRTPTAEERKRIEFEKAALVMSESTSLLPPIAKGRAGPDEGPGKLRKKLAAASGKPYAESARRHEARSAVIAGR